jgi:hypothetical protein
MLGCHVGNVRDTYAAIRNAYGIHSSYEAIIKAAIRCLKDNYEHNYSSE